MTSVNNKKSFTRNTFRDKPIAATPQGPSLMQNLKDSMVSGLGAGVGMSVADRLVSSVLGPRKVEVETTHTIPRSSECEEISKIYRQFNSPSLREAYEKCVSPGNSSQS
jgi:hypothetical protein